MPPRMSAKERDLFVAFLRAAQIYVEFGTGGSTCLATRLVREQVIALDSSPQWLDDVRAACAGNRIQPQLVHADIGRTREWGYPADPRSKDKWPAYHETLWTVAGSAAADLVLIDGRFRVACAAQTVLRCRDSAVICVHDFASRPKYHRLREIATEIATAENLSVFRPRRDATAAAEALLAEYRLVAD